ncbi:MAG: XdhC family protein [Lachnospirales bacterium]
MKELFEVLKERIENDKKTVLVTVISSKGSVPRGAGAYMLVGNEGRVCGSVGGGNIEFSAIEFGKEIINTNKNYIYNYDLSNSKAATLGMICGGSAEILYCPVDKSYRDLICEIINNFSNNIRFRLFLPLNNEKIKISYDFSNEKMGVTDNFYCEEFCYDGTAYIFGGGHISRECVPILNHLGFSCVVIDDREEFADKKYFPDAKKVICLDFENINIEIKPNDYILIMTRGHLADKDCLRFALRNNPSYIGVMGSKTKSKLVKETLISEGFKEFEFDRVFSPIGIDILSETPEEIAISIAAQLIKVRAEKYR